LKEDNPASNESSMFQQLSDSLSHDSSGYLESKEHKDTESDTTSVQNKQDNVDIPLSEIMDMAFMTDMPDNAVTIHQQLAFNENAFGYNAISDSFPEPPISSTQFTDKKYKQTVDIMRQLEIDDVNSK
jgi:hypothetical protein